MKNFIHNCPKCNVEVVKEEIKDGKCPKCGAAIRFEKVQNGNKFRYHLILDDNKPKAMAPGISSPIAELPPREGTLLTKQGEIPQIFLISQGEENIPAHYRVVYTGILTRDWVYCPCCEGKMFQNYYIDTGIGDSGQGHKCQHCNAKVDFVFHSSGVFRR